MDKQLHIISFDIPYPADYGGVIDVFYAIKNLSKAGVEIILHCFQYGKRTQQDELKRYCKEVFYYDRLTGIRGLDASLPYIISSRRSSELLSNLQKNEAPILFEGLHTTYYVNHPGLADRTKLLRSHNIESEYYAELARNSNNTFKKLYYAFEAGRLQRYEHLLTGFDHVLSISESDFAQHKIMYPSMHHSLVPAFHAHDEISSLEGRGEYCLYHGNLSVEENKRSVEYLIQRIFSRLDIKLIIAGKNPDDALLAQAGEHIEIIANPDEVQLNHLIQHAHINVLPSFQQTGLKLKLLNALFLGRHCVVNQLSESSLKQTVHLAQQDDLLIHKIQDLMSLEFTSEDIEKRKSALLPFDNAKNAERIVEGLIRDR